MMPTSSTVLDYLGTPAAVGTFGAIAAALLATSVCRQRASSGVAASSRRSEDTAGGPGAEEVAELDRTVSAPRRVAAARLVPSSIVEPSATASTALSAVDAAWSAVDATLATTSSAADAPLATTSSAADATS